MECKDYRQNFKLYLNKKLPNRETGMLYKHIESCPQCREELQTQYFVVEGLKRLETGDSFNLMHDFDDMLEETRKECTHIQVSKVIVSIFGIFVLAYTFLYLILGII